MKSFGLYEKFNINIDDQDKYLFSHHCGKTPPLIQIPQVSPGANLMNPFSPHEVPHSFLTFQTPLATPTKSAAWLIF